MAKQKPKEEQQAPKKYDYITKITVAGFKSIAEEQSVEIRPLTILAGANSSGKSSIMQPLLLLKQTLEAPYDPGALLLNGPNVRFTLAEQLLARTGAGKAASSFSVEVAINANTSVMTRFARGKEKGFAVEETRYQVYGKEYKIHLAMPQEEIVSLMMLEVSTVLDGENQKAIRMLISAWEKSMTVLPKRCFLVADIHFKDKEIFNREYSNYPNPGEVLSRFIRSVIHLPGLRGNPERTYPISAVGPEFPGTFERYVASIIEQWQRDKSDKLRMVNRDLLRLGLASHVAVRSIDDTQVEVRVNRFPHSDKHSKDDTISIADVGLGVSQMLPVIVACTRRNPTSLSTLSNRRYTCTHEHRWRWRRCWPMPRCRENVWLLRRIVRCYC